MSSNCFFLFSFSTFCSCRVSSAVHSILQKLCTILGLLKDLLSIERLSDSCILQLVKTSFSTFLVDHIQLLQLKAIGLISGVQNYTLIFPLCLLLKHTSQINKTSCYCYHSISLSLNIFVNVATDILFVPSPSHLCDR